MDRLVISKNSPLNLNITSNSYIVVDDEVQSKEINFNIMDCKVTIISKGICEIKNIVAKDSEVTFIDISEGNSNSKLILENNGSLIELNVIDLNDSNVDYFIQANGLLAKSINTINIASVCYKNKNKNYVINTKNLEFNTVNEINCFGIVKDESILNYDVTSFIKKGSKQSVVRQNSKILLFDEKSIGKNNPILEIEENDVKASHGSSIGKIDDDTMFYLCSRGLSKNEATNLICLGKVEYLIKKIDDEGIKEVLINNFKERMN